jgi:hypothetical protein
MGSIWPEAMITRYDELRKTFKRLKVRKNLGSYRPKKKNKTIIAIKTGNASRDRKRLPIPIARELPPEVPDGFSTIDCPLVSRSAAY